MERLLATVVVIGLLLWGVSVLATPDDADPFAEEAAPQDLLPDEVLPAPDATSQSSLDEPPDADAARDGEEHEDDDDHDDDNDRQERSDRKRKKRGPD